MISIDEIQEEKKYLSLLGEYVKLDKRNLVLTISALLIGTLITVAIPFYFNEVLSIIEILTSSNQLQNDLIYPFTTALSFYFILSISLWFVDSLTTVFSSRLNANIVRKLRNDTFNSLIHNELEFFDHAKIGDTTSILTSDMDQLYQSGNTIANIIASFLRLIGIIALLFTYSIVLTITSIILLPVFFIITILMRRFLRNSEKDWRVNYGHVNQKFSETLRSTQISKSFNRDEYHKNEFEDVNELSYQAAIKRDFALRISRPIADFLKNILLIIILTVGTYVVNNGGVSVADFYLFIFLLDYYYEPTRSIARNYNQFQSFFANLERILSLEKNSEIKNDQENKMELIDFNGPLIFKNVSFSYDNNNNNNVLNDISFSIEQNQRVAIVGETGSGKSTIMKLIMHLYSTNSGQIFLGNKEINTLDKKSIRRQFGIVSQDVLLFKGTILDNLKLGNQNITEEKIWNTLNAVQAKEFVEQLPEGLMTKITAGGSNLSAGQRQMLSIARTLLKGTKFVLLDEATSNIDLYTEAMIQKSTELLLKETTSLVIAHRLTTIIKSDWIIVMDQGKIVEMGSYDELLENNGLFKEMFDIYFKTQSAEYLDKIKSDSK